MLTEVILVIHLWPKLSKRMRALRKQRSVQAVRTSHHVIPCADIPQKIATIRFNAEVQYDGRG